MSRPSPLRRLQSGARSRRRRRPPPFARRRLPSAHRDRASSRLRPPSSAPARRGPITIYWTGPLRITPLLEHTDPSPPPGEAVVRLFGSPVHLQQETGRIQCALLQYRTADQTLVLTQSDSSPVVLQDSRGSIIHAQRMELDRRQNRAILSGTGVANLSNSEKTDNKSLTARWTKSCTLQFASDNGDALLIQSANLQGNVAVQTPELKLNSDALELTMAPSARSTTHPADPDNVQLQRAIATGNVHCILTGPQGEQTLDAQRLDVLSATTDTGRFYPQTIHADGLVKAVSAERTLAAGHIEVTLGISPSPSTSGVDRGEGYSGSLSKPSPQPSPGVPGEGDPAFPSLQILELLAQDNVLVTSADGATASADQIRMLGNGPDQRILLLGQPLAKVISKDSDLSGPLIEVRPQQRQIFIRGAGTIHARQVAKGSTDLQTADISWNEGAYIDGQSNLGEATGKVLISSPGPEGSTRSASAGRIKLHLADAIPSTRPATKPSQLDPMSHKSLQIVELLGDVEIKSETLANGQVLRGMNLHTDVAEYHAADGQFIVPGPGRMLAEDHRPTTKTTQPAEPLSPDAGDFRGMTAIQWQKQFVFNPNEHQARLQGDVHIVQEPAGDPTRRRELSADEVVVLFAAVPTTAPTTAPTAEEASRLQLSSVRAQGSIYFKTEGIECRAAKVDFDADKHILHATGDSTQRGELLDGQGLSRGGFDELWFDTQSQNLQIIGAHGQVRP